MPAAKDPIAALKQAAAAFPGVVEGTSCSQSSYKAGKTAFLYVGPGAKGVGYKAMFKLDASHEDAKALAKQQPDRFELGSGTWVTARFSAEKPLPKTLWNRWLKESYAAASGGGAAKANRAKPKSKVARKPTSARKATPRRKRV